MSMQNDTVQAFLESDLGRGALEDLGIVGGTTGASAQIIASLGWNIVERVYLEIEKQLPDGEDIKFARLIGAGDEDAIRNFLAPHIPDLDAFIEREAAKEYEKTKARAREIAQEL